MRSTTKVQLVLALLLCQGTFLLAEERAGFSWFGSFFFRGMINGENEEPEKTAGDDDSKMVTTELTITTESTTTAEPTTTIPTLPPKIWNGLPVRPIEVANLSSLLMNSVIQAEKKENEEECSRSCFGGRYGSFALEEGMCICSNYWRNETRLVGPKPNKDGNDKIIYMRNFEIGPEDCLLPTGSILSGKLGKNRKQKAYWLTELPGHQDNGTTRCVAEQFTCNNGTLNSTRIPYERFGKDQCIQMFDKIQPDGSTSLNCENVMGSLRPFVPPTFSDFEMTTKFLKELKPTVPADTGCYHESDMGYVVCYSVLGYNKTEYANCNKDFYFHESKITWAKGYPDKQTESLYSRVLVSAEGLIHVAEDDSRYKESRKICRASYPGDFRPRYASGECWS